MSDPPRSSGGAPGTPRWVKVLGGVVAVLLLVFVILQFTGGEHGPGRHAPSGGPTSFVAYVERGMHQP